MHFLLCKGIRFGIIFSVALLLCICIFALPSAAADGSHDAAATHLPPWRFMYSSVSTSTDQLLLQGRRRNYWRSLASVGNKETELDYGDDGYSPIPDVDVGYQAPAPVVVVGNRRKLLQGYLPSSSAEQ